MSAAAVQIEGLSFTYPGRTTPSLCDLHCTLPAGSWTVVVGGTGSGKSTLLRALAGLIPHHSAGAATGRVLLFARDTRDSSPAGLARTVGLVLQSPQDQICTTRVESEVAFGLENLATPIDEFDGRIAAALAAVGLTEFRHRSTADLSGGQKQRLVLASVLALRPQLLLLDEPLSQLDADSSRELLAELDRLRADGVTIVIAEHRLNEVLARADRVLLLDGGRLTFDGPADSAALPPAFLAADLELPDTPHQANDLVGSVATSSDSTNVLQVRDLSFRYPAWPRSSRTLKNISFSLRAGERVALIGANGSGKSTLLGVLAGLLEPDTGTIEQQQPANNSFPLGMVLQQADLMLFCRTVRDELAFGPRQLRLPENVVSQRVTEIARQMQLEPLLEEPPQALSQGQRLRVAIAATLTLRPQVLVLDEPTTGLDRRQLNRLMQTLDPCSDRDREQRPAVLFSTHDLKTVADWADRVIIMNQGEILADGPQRDVLKI